MSDLRTELDAALRTVVPGEAPVEAAMRRGRRLRLRRRAGAVAGVVAVAVFVTVGYPALTRQSAPASPEQHQRIAVTDEPAGPRSPPGAVAHGKVGGASWEVDVDNPNVTGSSGQGNTALPQCYSARGSIRGADGTVYSSGLSVSGCGLTYPTGGTPVVFTGTESATNGVAIGAVAPDVTYLTLRLADGQELKLIPVTAYGARLVAYVVPLSNPVVGAKAVLANGQYLAAVPFNQPGKTASFGLWALPGEHVPPTDSVVLTMGTTPDIWSQKVTAYEGPWGTCWVIGRADPSCVPAGGLKDTSIIGHSSDGLAMWGSAADNIGRILVTLEGGASVLEVPRAQVGDEQLWAFTLAKGQKAVSLKGYDSFGKLIWTGKLPL
jgi:hypothetical protein